MDYVPAELIKLKRDGRELTHDQIRWLVNSYCEGSVADYQMSAWLMAVCLKGMSPQETSALTESMLHSGDVLDFSHLKQLAVDKHSTGGVGDKTSLILAPLVASTGLRVPMIAGRGLGHTGGTLDKLEAIPGFSVRLSMHEFIKSVETLGVAIIGQTEEICPADKRIYALRDVTGTVESQPLICASIMSKKLAEGISALALDVKYGSGAFMKSLGDAETLADKLIEVGRQSGVRTAALITSMEQPLGRFVGNSLEVEECIAILKNETRLNRPPSDFVDTKELTLELAALMIWLGQGAANFEEGRKIAQKALDSGHAWQTFEKMCKNQGGNLKTLELPTPKMRVFASSDGYVESVNTEVVGMAALTLGAGRMKSSDKIDPLAGIEIHRKVGEEVSKGEALYTLYSRLNDNAAEFGRAKDMLLSATTISLQRPLSPVLIKSRKVN